MSKDNEKSLPRASYGGPKIKKVRSAVPLTEKQKQGKSLDLSIKATSQELDVLPTTFKSDDPGIEELRRLDLTGQTKLFKHGGLGRLRFVGGTLTWLNLSGVDCGSPSQMDWLFLKMMQTLFVLTMMNCKLAELPKELADVKSLKALVASHNSLTSPSLAHLSSLKSLNSLILSDNQLTSFPSSTLNSLPSLKKLSLANNKLTSDGLPSFAGAGSTLEELRLNGNAGITAIPDLAEEGKEASCSLALLELSHTSINDLKEIKRLQKLPRLVNLGLRDTPLSRIDGYRTKITELLPNLRILDNVRFDPLYLARKAKGKEPEEEAPRRGKGKGILQKSDTGWGGRDDGRNIEDVKGKRRRVDEHDVEPERRKRSNDREGDRHTTTRRTDASQYQDDKRNTTEAEEDVPVRAPARKRSKKNKKSSEALATLEPDPSLPAKVPKAIGGSLADPSNASAKQMPPTRAEISSAATAVVENTSVETRPDKEGLDLQQVPKKISSVVGVVEVIAPVKKGKERPKKGYKQSRNSVQEEVSTVNKPDILSLLAQEKEKAATIGGWD